MKKLFYLLCLFFSFLVNAQLYVSSNSYIYNKGALIYVKEGIELDNAGNIYLRNGGQLLQGTTGTSTNKGLGKLSVYQEGTVNNYFYNYWCSPVGNASAANGNENFGISMLHVPTTNISSTPAVMSGGLDGSSGTGTLTIATYWIWKFLSSTNYSQWFYSGASTNIAAGQGFTMKGTSGFDLTDVGEATTNNPGSAQRYDFRGKPNDGNIAVDVGEDSFTLTGNPYPSALHVNAFLLDSDNSACTGVAYYWEQDKGVNSHVLLNYQGGYGTYSPISIESEGVYVPATYNTYNIDGTLNTEGASSGLSIERKYAPIGQGFMVKGNANGILTLKNEHRVFKKEGDFSQFHRSGAIVNQSQNVPQIRLHTTINNQYTTPIALAFIPNATNGVDTGIDARSPVAETIPNDVYFFLEGNRYTIQGVSFDVNHRIAIGVKSTGNAVFKFEASQIVNFDENQPVYLYDALDETYHDIKNGVYEIVIPTGTFNNRFEITFTNGLLSMPDYHSLFVIFHNSNTQMVTVTNPELEKVKEIFIYDISGKIILNESDLDVKQEYLFPTNGLSKGIYLVELISNGNKKTVRKIMI